MGRISIAGLLGWVVVCAVGFAALVVASDVWLGATLVLTVAMLLGSVLGIVHQGWRGGGSLGFALFGWGFFLLGLEPVGLNDHLRQLSDPLARWAFDSSNPRPVPPPTVTPPTVVGRLGTTGTANLMSDYNVASADFRHRRANAGLIGQWLTILMMAMVGAVVGVVLDRAHPPR